MTMEHESLSAFFDGQRSVILGICSIGNYGDIAVGGSAFERSPVGVRYDNAAFITAINQPLIPGLHVLQDGVVAFFAKVVTALKHLFAAQCPRVMYGHHFRDGKL